MPPRTIPAYPLYHGQLLMLPKPPRTPRDAQAQEQQAGRNAQDLAQEYAMSCYHIVFRVLPFLFPDIPGTRPISRDDAHPMYPRYPRVFLCMS